MSSEIVRIYSLVFYTNGINTWDIIPYDNIKLSEIPDFGGVFYEEKLYPVRILKTSENKKELISIAMRSENLIKENKYIPHLLRDLSINQNREAEAEMNKEEIKEKYWSEKQQNEQENAIIFPYMIQTEDKVELIPQSNVWIFKDSFRFISNYCKISTTSFQEIAEYLFNELLGAENLEYLQHYTGDSISNKYIPLPKVFYAVIQKYVIENCRLESHDEIIQKFGKIVRSIFDSARLRKWHVSRRAESEIIRASEDTFAKESRAITKENEINEKENIPHSSNDLSINKKREVKAEMNKREEKEKHATEKQRNENRNAIIFPYMIQSEDKVEIIPQSNVWIFKESFDFVSNYCKRSTMMIRYLLEELLGAENLQYLHYYEIKSMSEKYIPLPKVVYATIREYVTENCSLESLDQALHEFDKFINSIFDQARWAEKGSGSKSAECEIIYVSEDTFAKDNATVMIKENKINKKNMPHSSNDLSINKNVGTEAGMNKEEKEKHGTEKQRNGNRNPIIFPYMIQTEDKVELIPQLNVWIFKESFSFVSNYCKRSTMMIRYLLKELLGAENLQYLQYYEMESMSEKYIPLPKVFYAAIREYVTENCSLESLDHVLRKFDNFINSIFDKARRAEKRSGSKSAESEIIYASEDTFTKENAMVMIKENEMNKKNMPHSLNDLSINKNIGAEAEKDKEEEKDTSEKQENKKERGIIFPYMIQSEDKVELIPQSNVWISNDSFAYVTSHCKQSSIITRYLFKNLLGAENLEHLQYYSGKSTFNQFIPLPEEFYAAVRKFVTKNCGLKSHDRIILKFKKYVRSIFDSARNAKKCASIRAECKRILASNDTNEINKEEIIFPYMIQSEDKVELIPQSNVWISENTLLFVSNLYETSRTFTSTFTSYLIKELLGDENLQYLRYYKNELVRGKYIPLPKEFYAVIQKYVIEKYRLESRDETIPEFGNFINSIFDKARRNRKKCASKRAEHERIIASEESFSKDPAMTRENVMNKEGEKDTSEKGRNEKNNVIIFPYMIQSKDKVELMPQSKVWIFKDTLLFVSKKYKTSKKITRYLFRELLGVENLQYLNHYKNDVRRRKYIPVPDEFYAVIQKYVTENCRLERHDQVILKFEKCVRNIFRIARWNEKMCASRRAECNQIRASEDTFAKDTMAMATGNEINKKNNMPDSFNDLSFNKNRMAKAEMKKEEPKEKDTSSEMIHVSEDTFAIESETTFSEVPARTSTTIFSTTLTTTFVTTIANIFSNPSVTKCVVNPLMTSVILDRKRKNENVVENVFVNASKHRKLSINNPQEQRWYLPPYKMEDIHHDEN